jgi:hypothetical protein
VDKQQMQLVTYAAFKSYLEAYPRKLERDVFGAYEPPLVTYNDFTLGNWPASVVASCSIDDLRSPPEGAVFRIAAAPDELGSAQSSG